MQKTFNLSLVLFLMMTGAVLTTAEEGPDGSDEAVVHLTIERLDAAPRDPDLLGQTTEESDAMISTLQERLMQGRQHPQAGPPFEVVDVSPDVLVPRNHLDKPC